MTIESSDLKSFGEDIRVCKTSEVLKFLNVFIIQGRDDTQIIAKQNEHFASHLEQQQ